VERISHREALVFVNLTRDEIEGTARNEVVHAVLS